jgi:hypothetical protein
MSPDRKTTIESELELLEKLHKLGDERGARMIARRLLISQTLSDEEKRRIDRVINASKMEAVILAIIVFAIFAAVYLYVQYAT